MKIECVRCPACSHTVTAYSYTKTMQVLETPHGEIVDPGRRHLYEMRFSCSCGTKTVVSGEGGEIEALFALVKKGEES